jgi:hypothetical protein
VRIERTKHDRSTKTVRQVIEARSKRSRSKVEASTKTVRQVIEARSKRSRSKVEASTKTVRQVIEARSKQSRSKVKDPMDPMEDQEPMEPMEPMDDEAEQTTGRKRGAKKGTKHSNQRDMNNWYIACQTYNGTDNHKVYLASAASGPKFSGTHSDAVAFGRKLKQYKAGSLNLLRVKR